MLLPHLKFIDLDKIFTEDTSHHEVPPCKISSKSKHFKYPKLSTKIKNGKKWPENRLLAGDIAMLWQERMNQGPKFLSGTVVDAQKKFHDPESIFWVSNNKFLETIGPEIA